MTVAEQVTGRYQWVAGAGVLERTSAGGDPLVMDSWLVDDGRVRALAQHERRFAAACADLFAVPVSRSLAFMAAAAEKLPLDGRWFPRVELVSGGDEPAFALWVRPAPPRGTAVRLWISDAPDQRRQPRVKGPDQPYLATLRQRAIAAGADEALLLSSGGFVREGSTTSILWWRSGALCAPPADSGVLPGVTAQLLRQAARDRGIQVVEEDVDPLALTGLEVWAVNALHGIRPVNGYVNAPIELGAATSAAHWNTFLVMEGNSHG